MKIVYHFLLTALLLMVVSCGGKKEETLVNLDLLICELPKDNKLTEQQVKLLTPFEKGSIRYLAEGNIFNSKDTISYVKKKSFLDEISQVQKALFSVQELVSTHLKGLNLSSLVLEQPLSVDFVKTSVVNYDFVLGFSTKQPKNLSTYSVKIYTKIEDILSYITDSILTENPDAEILVVYNPPLDNVGPSINPDGIELNKTALSFDKTGVSERLIATVYPPEVPEENKKVTWQSGDSTVAKVDATGLVTAVGNGSAVITAYTGNGLSATCYVTNGVPVTAVEIKPTSLSLAKGKEKKLDFKVLPEDATNKSVTWSSSNEGVAKVSQEDGTVKAIAKGKATITVTTIDGGKSAVCKVTVIEGCGNHGTISVPGGIYTGELKNCQPHGMGTLKYNTRTMICSSDPKKRHAEAGQYIVGQFRNGSLLQGKLFERDGNQIETIICGGGAY